MDVWKSADCVHVDWLVGVSLCEGGKLDWCGVCEGDNFDVGEKPHTVRKQYFNEDYVPGMMIQMMLILKGEDDVNLILPDGQKNYHI